MWPFTKKPSPKISVFNTKGREKQMFTPLKEGQVKMYSCGPTVYDYVHIGNLRAYLMSDIFRRTFEYAGYDVTQVMNVTDFGHLVSDADEGEDKMSKGLKREGLPLSMEGMRTLADTYTNAAVDDMVALNIKMPHVMPRASEHVPGMVAYIQTLLDKDVAYTTSDGVYFDTAKFPAYGILGGSASSEHSRVGVSSEKRNMQDFALWKFSEDMGWDAPWGSGFPGWHIECTAMATRYLGKSFDVHTGGIDLSTTHHNNEIAQAEAANNKEYARYWLHNDFVHIEQQKISKSTGNAINLRQLIDAGVSPLAYRYWLLTGHYRSPMNFTWDAVKAAHTALTRAQKVCADLKGTGSVHQEYKTRFDAALFDDFNTPEAVAVLWELLKDDAVEDGVKRATVFAFDTVLGLGFAGARSRLKQAKVAVASALPDDVQRLVDEREVARTEKDFTRADTLRTQIAEAGYTVVDGASGPTVVKKET